MTLRVSFAQTATEREVLTPLLHTTYGKAYGTQPAPADRYVVGHYDDTIVACLGMNNAGADGLFDIEHIYAIDRTTLTHPIEAQNAVQFCRLITTIPEVVGSIVYAGIWFAASRGATYGLLEHTQAVHKIIGRLGLVFYDVPHSGIRMSHVPECDKAFYTTNKPQPYVIILAECLESMRSRLTPEAIPELVP